MCTRFVVIFILSLILYGCGSLAVDALDEQEDGHKIDGQGLSALRDEIDRLLSDNQDAANPELRRTLAGSIWSRLESDPAFAGAHLSGRRLSTSVLYFAAVFPQATPDDRAEIRAALADFERVLMQRPPETRTADASARNGDGS